jgi:hypothetical protein
MFIVTKIAFGSIEKREQYMFDLSSVQVLEFAGTLRFISNAEPENKAKPLIQGYHSVGRAIEVFNEIVTALEEGKAVYHLPEE